MLCKGVCSARGRALNFAQKTECFENLTYIISCTSLSSLSIKQDGGALSEGGPRRTCPGAALAASSVPLLSDPPADELQLEPGVSPRGPQPVVDVVLMSTSDHPSRHLGEVYIFVGSVDQDVYGEDKVVFGRFCCRLGVEDQAPS